VPRLDIQQTVESPNTENPKKLFEEGYGAQQNFETKTKKKTKENFFIKKFSKKIFL